MGHLKTSESYGLGVLEGLRVSYRNERNGEHLLIIKGLFSRPKTCSYPNNQIKLVYQIYMISSETVVSIGFA